MPGLRVAMLAGAGKNNVITVGISSDRRDGPIINDEQAVKVADQLEHKACQPASRYAITL